jgi:hypothetical protein
MQRRITRREFLRRHGIASSALTLSPFFIDRFSTLCQAAQNLTRVYLVRNGDCFQNVAKLIEMAGAITRYVGKDDVVVIKGNAQWPNQGYTHTGCIKAVVDAILQIPGFSGEVLICDNVQFKTEWTDTTGFNASLPNRAHNYPDYNWSSLAATYPSRVAVVKWRNDDRWRTPSGPMPSFSAWDPANGNGWSRSFFTFHSQPTLLSSPVFLSPLTPGRMIDLQRGVWENGAYTDRRVRVICMPTLNNHNEDLGSDVAGVTSAIKSMFGATEILGSVNGITNGYYNMHSACNVGGAAYFSQYAGELSGMHFSTFFAPALYITAAMWSGWRARSSSNDAFATETKTVLACENPVTLDYVSCRYVINPCIPPNADPLKTNYLNPDINNETRRQILGCNSQGIGTIDPSRFEVIVHDFAHPTANRLDVERKIRDLKAGMASEQDVKDTVRLYMESEQLPP